jgi:8-oxo-dGTP diphosphatase
MTMEQPTANEVVQAAGGLVIRRRGDVLEIVVVHRPVHQDWSFPKGKLEEGETFETAALREVHEETGLVCRLLRFLGHTDYIDRKGRPKAVAYWVMAAEGGVFAENDEVDEVRWAPLAEAQHLLSYERDRELLSVLSASDLAERVL